MLKIKKNTVSKLKFSLLTAIFALAPVISRAECALGESGTYQKDKDNVEGMADALSRAFNVINADVATVSFSNCKFILNNIAGSLIQSFDYSKDRKKCSSVDPAFDMNLIGCEHNSTTSGSTKKDAVTTKKNSGSR